MRNRDNNPTAVMVVFWPLALGVFAFGVLASAQTRTNPSRSHAGSLTRVTLTGTVGEVIRHACSPAVQATQKEDSYSRYCATTDLVLATKDGFLNVRLGPTKFIRDNHFFFVDGDQLLVIGFLLRTRDRRTVVPLEVIKAKRDLTLRDPNGRPLWGRNSLRAIAPDPAIRPASKRSETQKPGTSLSRSARTTVAMNLRFEESKKEKVYAKYAK
jgi:hypothetical protein